MAAISKLACFPRQVRVSLMVAKSANTVTNEGVTAPVDRVELAPDYVLRELQDVHNVNLHSSAIDETDTWNDSDDEFEGLTVSDKDQNRAYDYEMANDAAARWLQG